MEIKNNNSDAKTDIFLSFIIPVYNVEKYLSECLNSLLNQDIPSQNYEIICVNDGSTDNSLDILKTYEQNYPNIHVISQENGGVCVARNTGMINAVGKYIWFIDSDELVQDNILGILKKHLEKNDCDRLVVNSFHFENTLPENLENADLPINVTWKDSVVWRSIFKKSFLTKNNLSFYPGLVFGEDALFMFECFYNEPRVAEIELPIYYHRVISGSASTNTSPDFMKKRNYSTMREAMIMQKYYENKNHKFPVETANRLMLFLWGILGAAAHMPKEQAKPYMSELKKCGLFPYKRPKACTITRSYQTPRTDAIGKLFDKIYTSSHTRLGFALLRYWYKLNDLKNKE